MLKMMKMLTRKMKKNEKNADENGIEVAWGDVDVLNGIEVA